MSEEPVSADQPSADQVSAESVSAEPVSVEPAGTVIGVCGFSAAGKTTFAAEMALRFRLPVLATGEVVRGRLIQRGEALTPEAIARVSDEIRQETGGRFVRVLAPQLARSLAGSPVVLVDCLREESDLLALQELSYRVALVAVTAEESVRIARAQGRAREGDPLTLDGFRSLDERERRLGVDRLVAGAEHQLDNDGTLGDFVGRAAAVVNAILAAG